MRVTTVPHRSRLLALALCLVLALTGCGGKSDLPPAPRDSSVSDQAQVLTVETEAIVNQYSSALEALTGGQIGLLTVTDVGRASLADYTRDVFNAWGIGDADKNNGVLLVLLLKGNGDYHCVQGKGLEKALPTSDLQMLLNTYLEPGFAVGDFDGGVRAFVDALGKRMAAAEGVALDLNMIGGVSFHPDRQRDHTRGTLMLLGGGFLLLCLVLTGMAAASAPARRSAGRDAHIYRAPGRNSRSRRR